MKEYDKLPIDHKIFARNLITFKGNQTRAYQATYPNCKKQSVYACASKLTSKDNVKRAISEIMEEEGLDDKSLSRKLSRLLSADKKISLAKDSQLVDVPDNPTRIAAINTVLKLKGHLSDAPIESKTLNLQLNNFPPDKLDRLTKALDSFNDKVMGKEKDTTD